MANDNAPQGLVPLILGRPPSVHYYRVNTAADLYLGMPLDLDTNGLASPIDVTAVTGNTFILGSIVGFAGTLKRGIATKTPYLKSADCITPDPTSDTGDRYVLVADDPDQEFLIQGDTGGTLATITAIGEVAAMLYRATSGNANTGWTTLELDASTNAANSAGSIVILRLYDRPNSDGSENAAGANYAKWVVRILNHRKRGVGFSATV